MNRALGMFEAQSKLWRLASLARLRCAGDQMGDAGRARRAAASLVSLCGYSCQRSAGRLLWRSIPHIIVTSATLRSLNSFSRLQGDEWSGKKAGDRFVALDSPFNHCEQGKLLFPGCALSLPSTTKSSTLLKWQPFSVSRWRAKTSRYVGTVCQRTGDAAVSRLRDGFTPDVAGAGRSAALPFRLNRTANASATVSAA